MVSPSALLDNHPMLTTNSESVLSAGHTLAQDDKDFMGLTKASTTLSGRIRFNRILADACFVSSLLSTHLGNLKLAARYARQSVVLNRRIWAALETKSNSRKATSPYDTDADVDLSGKTAFDPLSSMRTEKGVPLVMSVTHDALGGADFWSLVPSLYRALMQHSFIFAQQGLFQEAMYVTEQAEKVAAATNSSSLAVDNAGQRIVYFSESGRLEKAQSVLDSFDQNLCEKHMSKLVYHASVAKIHHLKGDFDKELEGYDCMDKLLAELTSPEYIKLIDVFQPSVDSLTEGISAMSLGGTQSAAIGRIKGSRGKQPSAKAATKIVAKPSTRTTRKAPLRSAPTVVSKTKAPSTPPQTAEKNSISEECVPLETHRTEVVLRKVMASLQQNDLANASILLKQIEAHEDTDGRDFFHMWVRFKALLSLAISNIAEDFTFNSLPESTIAFPAAPLRPRQSSEGAANKRPIAAINTSKSARAKKDVKEDFALTLQNARDLLEEKHVLCATAGSNHSFQQVSAALGHVTILLSAVSGGRSRGHLHPLYAAYMGGMYCILSDK
jgi:separase